jgi:flagellar assembly factor FliW
MQSAGNIQMIVKKDFEEYFSMVAARSLLSFTVEFVLTNPFS